MIKFSFNGIKNSLTLFSLFNFTFDFSKNKTSQESNAQSKSISKNSELIDEDLEIFSDYKTAFERCGPELIDKMEDDLIVYLFIEKEALDSSWHLVVPTILEKSTKRIYQFQLGTFSLEGCGIGLSNSKILFGQLKLHQEKGFKIQIIPKIIESKLLNDFGFADSGISLSDLLDKSIDIFNYQKNSFIEINDTINELLNNHNLN